MAAIEADKFSGYKVAVATGAIMCMYQGALGSFAVFIRPISESNGFPIGGTMLCVTFSTVVGAVLSFFAPPVIRRLRPRWCLVIATVSCGAHYWGFAFSHSLWLYWFWASVSALVVVFGTQAVIGSIVAAWFIEKRSTVLGFVFAAPALGTATWQIVAGLLITRWGYRTAYMIMGASLVAIALLINLCFMRMPEQLGQKPLGWERAVEPQSGAGEAPKGAGAATCAGAGADTGAVAITVASTGAGTAALADGVTVSAARKTVTFWLIFAGLMLSPMSVGGNNSNVATYLTGEGMSVIQASRYTSLIALSGSASTALSGFISQKMGAKVYVYYIHIAFILGTAVLLLNAALRPPMIIAAVLLYALAAPIGSAMSPTVNSYAFGDKDYANMLAAMAPAMFLGGAACPALTAAMLQAGASLKLVYVVFACCNLAGLILITSGLATSPYLKIKRRQNT
jgi:MFS family permease